LSVRTNFRCSTIALASQYLWIFSLNAAQAQPASDAAGQRALLNKYCAACHSEKLKTAGLVLENADLVHVGEHADSWETVVRKLRVGAMPPVGLPQPDASSRRAFVTSIETALDRTAKAHPNPGRSTVHRLNRTEFANAVRDLLNLEIDARSLLPADDTDKHGFDNNADVLSISPALLERYMSAARKVSRMAVGGNAAEAVITSYSVPRTLNQDSRMSQDTPFGSQGGIAVRHYFPADGEYTFKITLQRNLYGMIRGLGSAQKLDLRIDGKRIKPFSVGGEERGSPPPLGFGGSLDSDPNWERYSRTADESLEVRVPVKAGRRVVSVSFLAQTWAVDDVAQPQELGFGRDTDEMYDQNPAVESITITGPYQSEAALDTLSRLRIFVCRPQRASDEEGCAHQILSTLARRAYRRPVSPAEIESLMKFYRAKNSETFDARIEFALRVILSQPAFLFRMERDPANATPGSSYQLSDIEVASRLSFFLWSSIPDDELLDLATARKLRDPGALSKQVHRMLADRRSQALVDNFAGQWLAVRNIRNVTPDPDLYPEFDDNLRDALEQETQLFLASQIRDDRSLLELLTANYTFVNERLAQHYGIPGIYGERFRKVTFDGNQPRGGLLAQGSLLTVTSYPNRTSPVLRGKWLLENFLNSPPPAPPANVPALKENTAGAQPRTVRERLEEHRKIPTCAACHAPMDPLGFALENFNAIGGWRSTESGSPVDATGTLPGHVPFQGFDGLRSLLTTDYKDQFLRAVIERLLSYALGRDSDYFDMPTIREIQREASSRNYQWSAVIEGIVKSIPFQMRRFEP
jgi:mono/diheme cytochrome c family protein